MSISLSRLINQLVGCERSITMFCGYGDMLSVLIKKYAEDLFVTGQNNFKLKSTKRFNCFTAIFISDIKW